MTQTEIRQAAEKYADGFIESTGQESIDFAAGATTALTHGWNRPDVVPDGDTPLLIIWKVVGIYTSSGYFKDDMFYLDDDKTIDNVVAWRYDNAQDIYDLLKQNGVI